MRLDEDPILRERRNMEDVREGEEKKRRWVRMTNRRIWIERLEWRWVEKKEDWEKVLRESRKIREGM